MGDVRTSITDIAVHLAHDANVFIAVQQRVFVILHSISTMCGLVGLQAGVGQDDNEALGILIGGRDGDGLFGDELRQRWRWKRLGLRP